MGKVREHIHDDVQAMTQWTGRKIANHNPMSHRDVTAKSMLSRHQSPSTVRTPQAGVWLITGGQNNSVLYKLACGRHFRITVEEIEEDEVDVSNLVPVGA